MVPPPNRSRVRSAARLVRRSPPGVRCRPSPPGVVRGQAGVVRPPHRPRGTLAALGSGNSRGRQPSGRWWARGRPARPGRPEVRPGPAGPPSPIDRRPAPAENGWSGRSRADWPRAWYRSGTCRLPCGGAARRACGTGAATQAAPLAPGLGRRVVGGTRGLPWPDRPELSHRTDGCRRGMGRSPPRRPARHRPSEAAMLCLLPRPGPASPRSTPRAFSAAPRFAGVGLLALRGVWHADRLMGPEDNTCPRCQADRLVQAQEAGRCVSPSVRDG
jgi:hypothetical protein